MGNKSVIEILEEHLRIKGYDGLCNKWGECGCEIGDLMPCGDGVADCQAAYKHKVPDDLIGYYNGGDIIYAPEKVMDWDAVRKDRDRC